MIEVRRVAEATVRPLRRRILRPHQTLEDLAPAPGISLDGYFGAFVDGRLVGTVNVRPEVRPSGPSTSSWRLSGLAVEVSARRGGVGSALVEHAVAHVQNRGGDEIWCHGRAHAVPFYQALGFAREGQEFVKPDTGPYFTMVRALEESSSGRTGA